MTWLALIFLLPALHADKVAYPPQKISAQGIQQIRVVGVKGSLRLKGTSSRFFTVRVNHTKGKRSDDWNLSVERHGNALVLEVFNVAFGPQWRTLVREELWPEFDIELEGPAQPAVLSWREGALRIVDWKDSVEAAFLNGRFEARGMRGDLLLQAVDVRVKVQNHIGRVVLKGEKGRVDLNNIKGAVELNWLHGVLRGETLAGPLNFEMPSGNAELKNVLGPLKAKGQDSRWEVQSSTPSDLEVVTDSGPVKIRWRGGAKLFLSSQTGAIEVPKPFRVELREGQKVVQGVRAPRSRALVFVRTQSGAISWR